MVVVQAVILFVLAAVAVTVLVVMFRVLRGAAKRRLLAETLSSFCDTPDGEGVSVLYSGIGRWEQVADLLNVGYGRYEVVLVTDARRHPDEFAVLAARYSLIGVSHTLDEEMPVKGVRELYRSRKRCFRRLVVVDKAVSTVADDLNAAAGVATYDYVLPMREGWRLMPNAIGRMVAELSEHPSGSVDLVWSLMGVPAMLFSREAVIEAGGFDRRPWRRIPRRRRRAIYEPLLRSEHLPLHTGYCWSLLWALLLVAGAIGSVVVGWWMLCAVLLTVAVVWGAVRVAAPLITKGTGCAVDGPAAMDFLLWKFNVQNFTIS